MLPESERACTVSSESDQTKDGRPTRNDRLGMKCRKRNNDKEKKKGSVDLLIKTNGGGKC